MAPAYIPDIEFIEIGIDCDPVHLHMVILPKYAVIQVANRIKINTSRQMKQRFKFLETSTGGSRASGARSTSSARWAGDAISYLRCQPID